MLLMIHEYGCLRQYLFDILGSVIRLTKFMRITLIPYIIKRLSRSQIGESNSQEGLGLLTKYSMNCYPPVRVSDKILMCQLKR